MEEQYAAIYSKRGICCDLQQKLWREGSVGGSIRFSAKDSVVAPRVLLDRCPEQRGLSWMWKVCSRYIFQTQEDKGIIKSTGHRTQEGVVHTSSKDQMSDRYNYSTDAHVHWED